MQETASNLLGKYFKKAQSQKTVASSKDEHPLILKFITDPYLKTEVESSLNTKLDYSMNHVELPKDLFIKIIKEIEKIDSFQTIIADYDSTLNEKDKRINELASQLEQTKVEFLRFKKEQEPEKQMLDSKIRDLNSIIEEKNQEISKLKRIINEKNSHENELKDVNSC